MPQLSPMSILFIYLLITTMLMLNIFLQSYFYKSKTWKFYF
uniref:ATP synthase subunit 8 n=1 Tax=Succinea putris TaxID=145427 RepID=G8HSG9_9EUPU|nr:ATP synthase F0 subunit 8 [Succinea putris]AEQ93921.1 ATP synthase subunit 8 [Succinea putris]